MNVYDFDKTIYAGDSSLDFYLYCIAYQPFILKYLPKQIWGIFLFKLQVITKTQMKERFFSYLEDIKNIDAIVDNFWKKNQHKIYTWYIKQKQHDDVIISASPEFLLQPICEILRIDSLIASKVDKYSGNFLSDNCYGKTKPLFFRQCFPNTIIDCFYSDSFSDKPMAQLAKKSYLIKKGKPIEWPMEK